MHDADATQLVADLSSRKVSARELLEMTIARIEALDPQINAVVVRDFERARRQAHEADEALKPFVEGVKSAKAQLQDATMWLMQNGLQNPDNAAAASTDYLHLFGLTGLAYMWALIAQAANANIAAGDADSFYADKLITGRYFLDRILPDAGAHLAKLKTGAAPLMALAAEGF